MNADELLRLAESGEMQQIFNQTNRDELSRLIGSDEMQRITQRFNGMPTDELNRLTDSINSFLTTFVTGVIPNTTGATGVTGSTGSTGSIDQPCPGLERETIVRDWYVPDGYESSDRTYCGFCVRKYGLDGEKCESLRDKRCNCDSFLEMSGIDNSIFNISIWSTDQSTFYQGVKREDGKYFVSLPSGKFCILISNLQRTRKGQPQKLFRCKVRDCDSGEIITVSTLALRSVMLTPEFTFINNKKYYNDREVFSLNTSINIEIDVFNVARAKFNNLNDASLGTVEINDDGDYVFAESEHIRVSYDNELTKMKARSTYHPFTKSPIIFTIGFEGSDDDNAVLRKELSNQYTTRCLADLRNEMAERREQLKILGTEGERLGNEISEIHASIIDLQSHIESDSELD